MKKRPAFILLAVALLGVVAYNVRLHAPVQVEGKTSAASHATRVKLDAGSPQLAYIKVTTALEQPMPLTDRLNARLALDDTVTARIYTPLAGRVTQLHAELGQKVTPGTPLATLDSPDFGAALSDLAKAKASAQQSQQQLNRAKLLFEGEVLSRKDYEAAQADAQSSQAELQRAQLRLNNVLPEGKAVQGERFVLRSPVAGIVAQRQVNPGTEIQAGSAEPLFVVSDLRHLWLLIDMPERDLGHLVIGQSVLVTVDAWPDEQFEARIERISPLLDPSTRRIQVRCRIDNPKGQLRPEMFARASVVDEEAAKVVRVPLSALLTEGFYSVVFVEDKPGEFVRRRVSVARQDGEYAYLRPGHEGGLVPGEKLVVKGALLLNSELAAGN